MIYEICVLLATDGENIESFMYRVQHKQQKVEIKKVLLPTFLQGLVQNLTTEGSLVCLWASFVIMKEMIQIKEKACRQQSIVYHSMQDIHTSDGQPFLCKLDLNFKMISVMIRQLL